MSYTRSFSQLITLRYSGSVDGKPYSGTVSEQVHVNVHVDTTPFDISVNHGVNHVDVLTGAVTATEAAHIASIKDKADRIAGTLVTGFYRTVQSELTQQIAAFTSRVESLTAHLATLAKRCNDKQRQMKTDYEMLSKRYTKLFGDLNRELSTRVAELDRQAFKTHDAMQDTISRLTAPGSGAETAIAGAEGQHLSSKIEASYIKRSARRVVDMIKDYLARQRTTERILDRSAFSGGESSTRRYYPVIMIEQVGENGCSADITVTRPKGVGTPADDAVIIGRFKQSSWHPAERSTLALLKASFDRMVSNGLTADSEHERRVAQTIARMASASTPLTNI